MDALKN
jgi:membrane-bound lytic murein transglycosylase B